MRSNTVDLAREAIDGVRPTPAKATLRDQSSSIDANAQSIGMTAVVKDALIRHYGSLKAAAITFGMDQGQLTRELQSGDFKFRRLDQDEAAKACVARALYEAFGHMDPKAQARRLIREARARLDELAEVVA